MAATLTEDMKLDLSKGSAKILLALWSDTALATTTFEDADEIFTTNGTFAIAQGAQTMTDVKLDQKLEIIDSFVSDIANSTIAATIPSVALPLFEYFYELAGTQPVATEVAPIVINGKSYKSAKAFRFGSKTVRARMYVESESGKTAVVFMNTKLSVSYNQKNVNSEPAGFTLAGSINEDGDRGSIVVLKG